jgi:hypothetical protein
MTVSTTIRATGYHPYTLQPLKTVRNAADKQRQRMFFFWYQKEHQRQIIDELRRINRADLIPKLINAFKPETHFKKTNQRRK